MKSFGQKILITGGSSGIGLELARTFQKLGNHIIIVGLNRQKLEDVATFFGFDYIHADLANLKDVEKLVARINDCHADLGVLVNNAGIQHHYTLGEGKAHLIEEEVTVNLIAPIILTNSLLPLLIKNKGSIINITSGLALSPKRSAPVYCATKAGLRNFTKALRYQMEDYPVKVFEIIPPLVDTAMTNGRGKGKISTKSLANTFIHDFISDRYESYIGKAKMLNLIHRLSPAIADRIMKNN